MRILVCLALAGLTATSVNAQGRLDGPSGVVRRRLDLASQTTQAADSSTKPRFIPRALLGTAGAVGGVFAGAVLGVAILGSDCGCDDPGLPQALTGAVVGSVVGAAAVSAIPVFGSRCSYLGRFGRGLIGSAVGALLGGITSGGSELIVVTYPVGAGTGAAVGTNSC